MTRHLPALLALVILGSASAAADPQSVASSRASVRIVKLEVVPFAETQSIAVTSADLRRGYVELRNVRGANPALDHRLEVLTDGRRASSAAWSARPEGNGLGDLRFGVTPDMTDDHEIDVEVRLVVN